MNADRYGDPYSSTRGDGGSGTARPAPPGGADDGSGRSPAAARLLEMVARETDQWRSEARSEAAAIVAGAREEAAKIVRVARVEAEGIMTSAREKAAETTNDARVEVYWVRQETAELRKRHDEETARLAQVESEHKERLRGHLTEMLHRVDSAPEASN